MKTSCTTACTTRTRKWVIDMSGPEKQFENRVKHFLHSVGIYPAGYPEQKMEAEPRGWYFKVWGGGFQKAGIPDLILNVNGSFMAIEVKSQNGSPTDIQALNVSRIRETGGNAFILYPSGFNEFQQLINAMLRNAVTIYPCSYGIYR